VIREEARRGDVAVLSIAGEYDAGETEKLAAAVDALVAKGSVRVAVSLEKLTFIDSTALGSFLRAQETLQRAGGDIACAALSKFTAKNFHILGLDQQVRCFPTLEDAAAWLGGKRDAGTAR